jgi:DNA-binding response OmpR family regulator
VTEQARILVVDDEPTVQKLLVLTFRSRPWHVEAVGTAEEALDRCRAHPYDLMVLDKNLPAMSGPELLRILRDEGDTVSCILMTAYASAESAVEMMALGVDGYLEKPFADLDEVGEKVEGVLRQRREGERRSKSLAEARDHFRRAQVALGGDPASEAAAASKLAVLLACPSQSDREFFTTVLEENVEAVVSFSELMDRLDAGAAADLIIVDAVIASGALTDLIRTIRKAAPAPGLIVVADSVPLKLVTDLIDSGVDALVERPLDPSTFRRNTEHLLRRLR